MLIQGDNLDTLKALLPYYAGKVKSIGTDPPYNTKSAFEHYDDNLEHSFWLAMMYPRLELLRSFLSEDGSIWVSIDDNEVYYLKVIMDEIFGRSNFLTSFIWKKSYGGGAKSKWFVGLHEFILCYAKDLNKFPDMFLPPDSEAVKKYYKYKDDKFLERGPYRLQPLATTSMDDRPNLRYPIILSNGTEIWPEKQWQWSKDRTTKALSDDELVITEKKGKFTVSYKQYLKSSDGEERKRKLRVCAKTK
jgi:adenine-specific DNA-methyltransferase